jgi:hypothetical protein
MILAGIGALVARWARLYADHKAVSGGVTYVHLAGILLGGGLAVSADRAALLWSPGVPWTFRGIHRWVLTGLGITFVSGVAMLLSDLHTYLTATVFWIKMALIVLLIANGFAKLRTEAALDRGGERTWRWFRRTAIASLTLWFATLLAGTVLMSSS